MGVPSGDQRREVMFLRSWSQDESPGLWNSSQYFFGDSTSTLQHRACILTWTGEREKAGVQEEARRVKWVQQGSPVLWEGHKGVSAFSHFPDELKSRDLGFQRGSCLAMAPIPRSHSDGKSDSQRPPDPLCGFFQEPSV